MKTRHSCGAVVMNTCGEVVVVEQYNDEWSLPKGHIEEGEEWLDCLRRELYEEAGIEYFEFVRELGTYERYRIGLDHKDDKTEWKIIHLFLLTTTQEKLEPTDPEHPQALWIPKEEVAAKLTIPKDKEFFESILKELP